MMDNKQIKQTMIQVASQSQNYNAETETILSIASAQGWFAVYKHDSDGSVFKIPLMCWGLVKDWDETAGEVALGFNDVVGFILDEMRQSIIAASFAPIERNDTEGKETPAYFCGYLAPGEELGAEANWKSLL